MRKLKLERDVEGNLAKGIRLQGLGQHVEAARCFRRVLRHDKKNPDALHLLALLYEKWGNLDRAVQLVRSAIDFQAAPKAPYHTNLGNFLHKLNRFDQAIDQYRLAIAIDPSFDLPRLNLATTLRALGNEDESRQTLESALEICPDSPDVCFEAGSLRVSQRRFDEAEQLLERAVKLKPARIEAWIRLALVLDLRGKPVAAAAALYQALKLEPQNDVARTNLSTVLAGLANAHESEKLLLEVLKTSPRAEVFAVLGTVYKDLGYVDLALDCYAKALDMAVTLGEYQNFLYTLLYDPSLDDAEVAGQHRDWARQFAEPLRPVNLPECSCADPDRPLRIGYVSGHFRDHAVSLFSRPMILAHDRDAFHITCYSSGTAVDSMTDEFRHFAHQWRDISVTDDETAAQMVREDQIDILVDLAGHIGGNRLLLFARKRAPIQMTYLGYQHTTGMEVMDYRITDAVADPPGETDHLYVEKLLRLEPGFFVYAPSDYAPEVAPPPVEKNGWITFGCLNNPTKHGAAAVEVFAQLLHRVADSRLLLLGPTSHDADPRVARLFESHGICADRVRFVGKRSRRGYLANYSQIDVALDPLPFSGHTTTCDALWQGVPVVTLAGRTYASRMSSSTLMQARFPQWIASSPDQYIKIAAGLAEDRPGLAALRESMRERLRSAPILDANGFTKSLETAFKKVWRERCAESRAHQSRTDTGPQSAAETIRN
jgi:predicted O-linked N-acetylglucosamine transferase (SPINDLY family)